MKFFNIKLDLELITLMTGGGDSANARNNLITTYLNNEFELFGRTIWTWIFGRGRGCGHCGGET